MSASNLILVYGLRLVKDSMTRDLHSAILFCAALTSKSASNNAFQSQACASARPFLSTLFSTEKEKDQPQFERLFNTNTRPNHHGKTSQPRFFDPSYMSHDYRMRHAFRLLRRAASSAEHVPSFLQPRPKSSRRLGHSKHSNGRSILSGPGGPEHGPDRLPRTRPLSTDANKKSERDQSILAPNLRQVNRRRRGKPPTSQLPGRYPIIDLDEFARHRDFTAHLRHYFSANSPPGDIESMPPTSRLNLCLALLLSAFQLSQESRDTSNASQPVFLRNSTRKSSAAALEQSKSILATIDPTLIDSNHTNMLYRIANAQILALEGRYEEAERTIQPQLTAKGKVSVASFWMVLHTYHIVVNGLLSQGGPLELALLPLLTRWETFSSALLGEMSISTPHLTRIYGTRLKHQIFEALPQISGLPEWLRSLRPRDKATRVVPSNYNLSRISHKALSLLVLHHMVDQLNTAQVYEASSRSDLAVSNLALIVEDLIQEKYSIPDNLILRCIQLLNRAGYPEAAQKLFDRISTASMDEAHVMSINLEIAAQQGNVMGALDMVEGLLALRSLQKKDIRRLLKAYVRAPAFEVDPPTLVEQHNDGHASEGETNNHQTSALDRLDDAEEIFTRILAPHGPARDDYSILATAYARRGNVSKVTKLFEKMLDSGILARDLPWEKALRALAIDGNVQSVVDMLDHMQSIEGYQPGGLFASEDANDARKKHRWGNVMTVSVFNVLLELMVRRRDPLNASRLWRNLVNSGLIKPNITSTIKLLRAHAGAGHWVGVIRAWNYMQKQLGPKIDQSASQVADQSSEPNLSTLDLVSVYNTVLRAYVALGTPFAAIMRIFQRMVSPDFGHGITPDSFTYTLMIIAASDAGNMPVALEFFAQMEKQEHSRVAITSPKATHSSTPISTPKRSLGTVEYRPIFALTHMLAGFLRQEKWRDAREVYEQIEKRGLKLLPLTCAVIVRSYVVRAARRDGDESLRVAEDFLDSMQRGGWDAVQPKGRSLTSFAPLMAEYVRERKPEDVERLLEQMLQIGGDLSIHSLTMLMDVYRRIGDLESVRKTWRAILLIARDELKKDRLALEISTPTAAEAAELADTLDNDELDLRHVRSRNYARSGRALLCFPFSIFMDVISAAGYHEEVAAEWKKLQNAGFSFDPHNWNHLVTVLMRAGEVEKAFAIVEDVIIPFALGSKQLTSTMRLPWEEERDDSRAEAQHSEDPEEETPPLVDDEHVHWGRRRVAQKYFSNPARQAAMELVAQEQAQTDGASPSSISFVHELELLQRISRNWYQWKPHKRVLWSLSRALLHLENGRMISPLDAPGMEEEWDGGSSSSSSEEAHALLGRLRARYPRTCKLAYDQIRAK